MAGYIGPVPTPQATQSRDYFTATAGQTSFPTSGYTPGYLDVYLNGVHLQDSDFTATNGSDVVLNDPCAADDVVLVVAWSTFEATNVDYSNVQNTPTNLSDFVNDIDTLPDQAGNDGRYLQTDGTNASWQPLTQVKSDIHVFYTDANGDLIWEHGNEVTALQDANGDDLYDLVIVGSDDQTYSVDNDGNLIVTIG